MKINVNELFGQNSQIPCAVHTFPQSLRLLNTKDLPGCSFRWVSLRNIWPEYCMFYWPAVDVTNNKELLTDREKVVLRQEWIASRKEKAGRALVLLFWQNTIGDDDLADQIDNVIFVKEEDTLDFDTFKHLDIQPKYHSKEFWQRQTAGYSFEYWFMLAVRACNRKVLFSKLGTRRPYPVPY